jgi:hypothetical protein
MLGFGVAAALAGCTAEQRSGASTAGFSGADVKQVAPAQADGKGQTSGAPVGRIGGPERKLVRSARLALTAPDVKAAVDQARQIAIGAGGFTGAEHTDSSSATLTLSVAADKLDAALGQLATLSGTTVTSREQTAQDVTDQTVDVEARLATQRASVERVRALLARANSVSEIASVEGELTTRESELESLQRRRDALVGSVAMSTVTLSVSAPAPAPANSGGGFLGGLAGGWDAFLAFGGGVLTVLGALAPFLLVLGTPAVAAFWWFRRRRAVSPVAPVEPE